MTVKQRNALLAEMTDAVAERVLRGSLHADAGAVARPRPGAGDARRARPASCATWRPRGGSTARSRRCPTRRRSPSAGRPGWGSRSPSWRSCSPTRRSRSTRRCWTPTCRRTRRSRASSRATSRRRCRSASATRCSRHRLRREIIATRVTNDLVDRAGTTFVFRLREDTGASHADIARASVIARDVFDVRSLWPEVEALDGSVAADVQIEMLLAARRMVERATRWLLRTRPRPLDIAAEVRALRRRRARRWPTRCRACSSTPSGRPGASGCRGSTERGRARGARRRAWPRRARCSPRSTSSRSRRATERDVDEVAALHFLLGGAAAPALAARPDRAAPARHPLGGDGARGAARRPVLPARGPHADVLRFDALDAWFEANRAAVERAQEILGEIRAGGTFDLTTLPVALREVRNLIASAGRSEACSSAKNTRSGTRRPTARSVTTGRARRRCC